MAIVNTLYAGLMCILNQASVRRTIGYRQEIVRTFLIPTLCAVIMGVVAWGVYEGLFFLTKSMRLALIPAVGVAIPVYFVLLILLRGMDEQELRGLPKGYLLVKLAKKCRLL